jgi:hypothetical protein
MKRNSTTGSGRWGEGNTQSAKDSLATEWSRGQPNMHVEQYLRLLKTSINQLEMMK